MSSSSEIVNKHQNNTKSRIETKEIRFSKVNPSFNLVSLKARYRLNDFNRILPKKEYHKFFQSCKNMCHIGREMSKQFSMNDLHKYEKISSQKSMKTFYTIDTKIVKNIHKYKIKKETQNSEKEIKENEEILSNKIYNNISKSNKKFFGFNGDKTLSELLSPINTSYGINSLNVFAHISPLSYYSKGDFKNFSHDDHKYLNIQNFSKLYKSTKTQKNKNIFKNYRPSSRFINQYKKIKNSSKENKSKAQEMNEESSEIISNNISRYLKEFSPYISKKPLLISKRYSSNLDYTKCGGIIHKNSIWRNVSIKYMLPKPINLPFIRRNMENE